MKLQPSLFGWGLHIESAVAVNQKLLLWHLSVGSFILIRWKKSIRRYSMELHLSAVALRIMAESMLYRRWPSVTYLLAFGVVKFSLIPTGMFLIRSGFAYFLPLSCRPADFLKEKHHRL